MPVSRTVEILEHYVAGRLFQEIFSTYALLFGPDRDGVISDLVASHNKGDLNLLSLVSGTALDAQDTQNFFRGQHLYCSLIPLLEAPATQMVNAVKALIAKGGQDLAAHSPNQAFAAWCAGSASRVDKVIELAAAQDLADSALSNALVAGIGFDEAKYLGKARLFIDTGRPDYCLSAVWAIGRANWVHEQSVHRALSALEAALDGQLNDRMRAAILLATISFASRALATSPARWTGLITNATADPGPEVSFACAKALAFDTKTLPGEAVDLILLALQGLDPMHSGTINFLDIGLVALLDAGQAERVIPFLETLLSSHEGKLELKQFDSLSHAFRTGDGHRLCLLIVRLFLSGGRPLCEAASSLVQGAHDLPLLLEADLSTVALSAKQATYLARKALGYFLHHPVTAASFIISLLQHASDDAAEDLRTLMFDPLLLNYSGATRAYLEQVVTVRPGTVAEHIAWALKRQDEYLENLRSVGEVPELHPSERQRRIEHERERDMMSDIMKEAHKKSVIRQLVKTSVLLHGTRSITRVGDLRNPGSPTRRLDVKLGSVGTSMEMPRTMGVDPFGLDYRSRIFRAEQPPE